MTKKQALVGSVFGIIFAAPLGLLAIKGLEKLVAWLWPNCKDPLAWTLITLWVVGIALIFPVVTFCMDYFKDE